jgi:pimeloyl-ACP methyl ester carboxylesterase
MRRRTYSAEQGHILDLPRVPLLYMHGERDGCLLPEVAARTPHFLGAGSEFELVADAGHFLHLERPHVVNERIAAFIA